MAEPIYTNGAIVTYNTATGTQAPAITLQADGTASSAAVPLTLLEVPEVSGMYLVSFYVRSGQAASTSSILGPISLQWTCADCLVTLTQNITLYTAAWGSSPQFQFSEVFAGMTTPSYPVGLVTYTVPNTALYRLSGSIYPTTLNSGAWAVNLMASYSNSGQAGSNFIQLAQCQLQAGNAGVTPGNPAACYLTAGTVITFNTITASGTESGGVYTAVPLVEQLSPGGPGYNTVDASNVHGGLEGSIVINALAGQPINVGIGYTSVGATPMQFDYHVKAVYIGGIPS